MVNESSENDLEPASKKSEDCTHYNYNTHVQNNYDDKKLNGLEKISDLKISNYKNNLIQNKNLSQNINNSTINIDKNKNNSIRNMEGSNIGISEGVNRINISDAHPEKNTSSKPHNIPFIAFDKNNINCIPTPIRKGRFVIEQSDIIMKNNQNCIANQKEPSKEGFSTLKYKKGRFHVTEAVENTGQNKSEVTKIISILNLQNKQIDILFDMINNLSGNDKLFQREFISLSNDTYELIESLRRKNRSCSIMQGRH